MISLDLESLSRRGFLQISALWATAAALAESPQPAWAVTRKSDEGYHAVVIGAGLGGLALAGYLAKNGFKVLVLEQHDIPGGYATTFTRDGGRFTFDVSLHQTALGEMTSRILKDLGVLEKVPFYRSPTLFRVISPGLDITCPGADPQAFQEVLIKRFPHAKEGIRGFVGEMLDLNTEVESFFKAGKLTVLGKLTFPFRYPKMWASRNKTLSYYLDKYAVDPGLRSVLSVFCGYYGLPPEQLSGFYYMNATGGYLRYGGSYPRGGSMAISSALVDFIEARGGEVRLGTLVDKILVENNSAVGIRTSAGAEIRARSVVANSSALNLFRNMFSPEGLPESYLKKINSYKPSVSSFQVWLALNEDITNKIKDSHIFMSSGLDPEKSFQFSLDSNAEKAPFGACIYNNIYKDYSPKGTSVISLTMMCGFDAWRKFEKDYRAGRKRAYHARKKEIADTIVRRAEKTLLPGLSNMSEIREAATPLTNVHYTLNTDGAIYGFEQSMDNAFMNRLSNRTPMKNLFLSSAWGEPGGGYTGVLISGKRTFGMLMEDWK